MQRALRLMLVPQTLAIRALAIRALAATALAATLCAAQALADTVDAGASALRRAELSARLFATGLADADALLVIAAARLRRSVNPVAGDLRPADPEDATASPPPLGWQEMLAEAARLAPGDALIADLIDEVQAETAKGVVSGPIYGLSVLNAGRSDLYERVPFEGGTYAEVYVEARNRSDLKLFVEDDRGRLVCSDTDVSHIAYCGWRPGVTAGFTIRVENRGPQRANYALMTN